MNEKEQRAILEQMIELGAKLPMTEAHQRLLVDARMCQYMVEPQKPSLVIISANIANPPGSYSHVGEVL